MPHVFPFLSKTSDMTNKTRKMIKNIFAILADAPAMPENPSNAAITAMSKKPIDKLSPIPITVQMKY